MRSLELEYRQVQCHLAARPAVTLRTASERLSQPCWVTLSAACLAETSINTRLAATRNRNGFMDEIRSNYTLGRNIPCDNNVQTAKD
jgi:hypothetical protein